MRLVPQARNPGPVRSTPGVSDKPAASIQQGSEVLMHFAIRLEDGTVADATEVDDPMRFVVGDGTLIGGLELALYGLHVGDTQTLTIGPENAYGARDSDNIHRLDRAEFPAEMALAKGVIVGFSTPAGDEIPGMVMDVGEKQVTVDFNHPMAGHDITFEVEILDVSDGEQPLTVQ
ncbi:MAG: FKBP-type peptidyl-prolyl cis-trans isomerase [Gammaproteobacteria bacterium]|nr:FKBP-type peptidyl-prolyl cis-trans isomerase [Gammaproteobacteria bacterium]